MQRLLFFCDYGADPLWELPSESMVSLDALPLSGDLRDAVRAWAARWEAHAWQQMDADVKTGQAAIDEDGRVLWLALQRELAGQYMVGRARFDGLPERHVQWSDGGPLEPCPPAPE